MLKLKLIRCIAPAVLLLAGVYSCGDGVDAQGDKTFPGVLNTDGGLLDINVDSGGGDAKPSDSAPDAQSIEIADDSQVDVQPDVPPVDNAPTIEIVSPKEGDIFLAGKNADFTAKVADDHDAATTLKVKISDSADATKALYDGVGNDGATPLVSAAVTSGSHTITFEVTDSAGQKARRA